MRSTLLALVALLASCGHPNNTASLASLAESVGTLTVDPAGDPNIVGGTIQYRVYESGDIVYSGDVTYKIVGSLNATIPFSGHTKLAPQSVLSASYVAGAAWTENKVGLAVAASDAGIAKVQTKIVDQHLVDSNNASGTLSLKTKNKVVSVGTADISGTLFAGTPAERMIHLKLSDGN